MLFKLCASCHRYTVVIARWLEAHPMVSKVNYPGLESNVGKE